MSRRVRINPPGYIPNVGQGLLARTEIFGSTGGRTWLKANKLHKYWPSISNLTYANFISLKEENVDRRLSEIGSWGMTEGAKRKLLRLIELLRSREERLAWIRSEFCQTAGGGRRADLRLALKSLREILYSPLPEDPTASLITDIILTVAYVHNIINAGRFPPWVRTKLSQVLEDVNSRPVLMSALQLQGDLNRSRQPPRRPWSPTIRRPLRPGSSHRPSPPVTDDWYRPSDAREGIWPQGENNVSFNIWPRALLETDVMTPVEDTSLQSLAPRSSVVDAPSSSAVTQFDGPEGLSRTLLQCIANALQLPLPDPSRPIWSQGDLSASFNIWPRTLLEPDVMTPVEDTSPQSLAPRSSVVDAPSSSAVTQLDGPEGLSRTLLHCTAPSGPSTSTALLHLPLPDPSRRLLQYNLSEDNEFGRPPFHSGQLMPRSPHKRQ